MEEFIDITLHYAWKSGRPSEAVENRLIDKLVDMDIVGILWFAMTINLRLKVLQSVDITPYCRAM